MPAWLILTATAIYMAGLFAIAARGDRDEERPGFRPNRFIFPLALAVYCTSWTYFGAVGSAAASGWDYLPIYLGPALVFLLMPGLLRRIGEVVKRESVSSLSDFLSARYGKSRSVGAFAAVAAVMGGLPYIALQLKSIGMSFEAFAGAAGPGFAPGDETVLVTALALAAFSVLYGTRFPDATRSNTGLMRVLAIEALVKIGALAGVAILSLILLSSGDIPAAPTLTSVFPAEAPSGRFIAITLLSMAAIVCLPHEFHVAMIERRHEGEMTLARWIFPLYLLITTIVVVPITLAGLGLFAGAYPADLFVLQLPLSQGNDLLATFVFLGGFSAATGMVIVSTIALSNMVTNDLIVPALMRSGNLSGFSANAGARLVTTRRIVIVMLLLLAYCYYLLAGPGDALAQIGLLAFAAAAQFAPAIIAAVYWRGARRGGVLAGLITGMVVWLYTLFLPSILGWHAVSAQMPGWLDPHALFGLSFDDPLTHGAVWSLGLNIALMVVISFQARERLRDRVQAAAFVGISDGDQHEEGYATTVRGASPNGLKTLAARFLSAEAVDHAFEEFARASGIVSAGDEPADGRLVQRTERLLASALGASSARIVLASAIGGKNVALPDVLSMLDSRTQAERFERHMLQSMLENIAQGISVVDSDQKLVAWNSAYIELFQYPPELCRIGTPVEKLITHNIASGWIGGNADQEIGRRIHHMKAGGPHTRERQIPDGRWLRITGAPMPGGGYVTTFTDITADKLRERALIEANETLEERVRKRTQDLERLTADLVVARQAAEGANASKTRFLAAASHDLLQPLNAARLLLGAAGAGRSIPEAIEKADRAIQSADELLRGLLDVSRLDHAMVEPAPLVLPVGPLLEDLVDENIPMAEEVGIEMRLASTRLAVEADPDFLKSILRNFISNARRYTRSGAVLVGARRRGDQVRIEVWDTGPGIAQDQLPHVFEEFRRFSYVDNTGQRGAGLGLAVARRLAAIMNVGIGVRSWPGKGSVFWVTVPAAASAPARLARPEDILPDLSASIAGLDILFIDDETSITDAMRLLLEGWGCRIRICQTPAQAIASLSDCPPDVMIADFDLRADQTGLELITQAQVSMASPRNALLITAASDEVLAERATAARITLLRKPVNPADLKRFLSDSARRLQGQPAEGSAAETAS
ncbi:PAS-domain containing protein [Hyphomonas sp.]|uniref:hybrid sensor histidine kinase/response regulator n=1 Tax=Hyphomonas sp. TaxID=87 RepID=UPI001BCFD109|nr:PAS-domain containing protein [Hyphomonas sp.]